MSKSSKRDSATPASPIASSKPTAARKHPPARKRSLPSSAKPSEERDASATTPSYNENDQHATKGDGEDHPPPQAVVDAWYDCKEDDPPVGYKSPPKKHQFKEGQSGNPSGGRKPRELPTGNLLQHLGQEIVDEFMDLMQGDISDLTLAPNDAVTTGLAKTLIADTFKREGTARKFVMNHFMDRPLQSDRLAPVDPREEEANILRKMMQSILDPDFTDEDWAALRSEANEHYETYGEFGARRRKERKKKRRRKP